MSTQSTPSILFTHRSPQQGFRLLELPPALAELLSSDSPPTLELKSPAPATSTRNGSSTTVPSSEYVNLCTPSETYSVRQVQSSNSLHILRPSNGFGVNKNDLRIVGAAGSEQEDGGGDIDMDTENEKDLNIEGMVTSVAKCGWTLELHKSADGFSAKPFFRSLLKVYDKGIWEDGNENKGWEPSMAEAEATKVRTEALDGLLADVPVSRAQCKRDWVEICAFVLPRGSAAPRNNKMSLCWMPSAEMKLEVWKRVVEGSVLQGIDLGAQFLVNDLWKSVLDDEGLAPFPRPLFEAVVRRICELPEGAERDFAESEMKWSSIDKTTCIRWVGEIYLEAKATGTTSAIDESEFINVWKDQLPESWREDVSKSILPDNCYIHPEPKTICFATETDRQKVKKNLPTDTNAATAAKKTRNWHELFKNQKRQKR